jgi:uncharacterized protein
MIAESLIPVHFTARQNLLRNLVLFARLLRGIGIDATPDRIIDLVSATSYIDLRSRADFKASARAILVGRQEQLALFDRAFDLFWRRLNTGRKPIPETTAAWSCIRRRRGSYVRGTEGRGCE